MASLKKLFLFLALCVINTAAFKFSIVIDAGSTGCRLYVYQDDHTTGHITGKVGAKVKPGLSTFKTHPQDLKEFITPLFKEAQTLVPQSEWSKTSVYIKATAGMRLVTEEQARVIYDTIYAYLSTSPDVCPFNVKRSELKTITGTEEGYFGALSANYLSGVIDNNRRVLHKDTGVLGALDLGGSSTQVSLYTAQPGANMVNQEDFFVHSFLGFGVEKMAERYLTYLESSELKHDPCSPKGYVNPSGGMMGIGDYSQCKQVLSNALGLECSTSRCLMDGTSLPPVSPNAKFIGMSVYFYAMRTVLLTLSKAQLPVSLSWPSPTLEEMTSAGTSFCSMPWSRMESIANTEGWEPFTGDAVQRKQELPQRCIQTAFIEVLLGRVYGIPRDKRNVMIALDIDNMEVEWTLGSVIANAGENIEVVADDVMDTVSFDSRLVFFIAFLTIAVAFFVFKNACKKSRERGGRGAWSSFLTAGFTSKAAFLVRV